MDDVAFRVMLSRDPDGKDTEPTEEDYRAFEKWAVETYGREAWDAYNAIPGGN